MKKDTKPISQPTQYIKKTDKGYLKKNQFWVKEMKNKCKKKETKAEKKTRGESYSVLKKKINKKKLNFQPTQ